MTSKMMSKSYYYIFLLFTCFYRPIYRGFAVEQHVQEIDHRSKVYSWTPLVHVTSKT